MKIGGGHFAPKLGGQFELESGGHFKLELGGQYHWNLHYKNKSGLKKDISLRHLRKTYISWVNQVMGGDTRILTSHSTDGVLKEHYLDPTILDTIQKGMLNIKVFGK